LDDKAALHGYKREFLDHVRNRLHRDFDRGFFSAWADCMRVLSRITVPHVASSTETNGIVSEGEKLETVKADNGQATIENFLEDQGED
jgi:hypothetical protein